MKARSASAEGACFQFLGIPPKGERTFRSGLAIEAARAFPISRDPPEGGTTLCQTHVSAAGGGRFQFLGIPPKGEPAVGYTTVQRVNPQFPISRDPPEGGTPHGSRLEP